MHPPRVLTVMRSLALLGTSAAAPSSALADPPAPAAAPLCPARRSEAHGACSGETRYCRYDGAGNLIASRHRDGTVCWCSGRPAEGDPQRWRCHRSSGVVRGPLAPPELAAE